MSSAHLDVDMLRQANAALARNVEFCRSGPGRVTLNQIEELRQDFRQHLSWMMNMGRTVDTFSRTAVPNYLVRVVRPLSQSLRLDFLLGKTSECFLEVRGLLEQLARSFEADVRFSKEKDFSARLSRLDSSRPDLSGLVGDMDPGAAAFLVELSSGWVRTEASLTTTDTTSLAGGARVFSSTDLGEVARLGEAVGRFRQLLSRILEKWKDYQEKKK